jgi:hypothetical protein
MISSDYKCQKTYFQFLISLYLRLLIALDHNSTRREMELCVPEKSLLSDNFCIHCRQIFARHTVFHFLPIEFKINVKKKKNCLRYKGGEIKIFF